MWQFLLDRDNGVKWLEGYHRTMSVLVVPRGCSWYDEYPGATVRNQVNHGILARHLMKSVPSYDEEWWYDDEYWYGDVPSCGGTIDLIGGMMNSGGVTQILMV